MGEKCGMKIRITGLTCLAVLWMLSLAMAGCQPAILPTSIPTAAVTTPAPMVTVLAPTQEAAPALPAETPTPSVQILASLPQPISYLAGGDVTALHVMDAGNDVTLLTDEGGFASLQWSPDGRMGLAVTTLGGKRALSLIEISARSARQLFATEPSGQLEFRVAQNWSRVLMVERIDGVGHRLWIVDVSDGASRQLAQTPVTFADWRISGDGGWALAGVEAEGRYSNTLFDLTNDVAYELDSTPHPVAEFSPDGRWLCLVGRAAGDTTEKMRLIDLHDMDEGPVTRVVALGDSIRPAVTRDMLTTAYFSADGQWVGALVAGASADRLRLRDLDRGENIDLDLETGTSLDWVLVYSSLRRVLVATITPDLAEENLHLWYLDQRVEIPLIQGASTLALLPDWSGGVAVVDGILPDARHLIAVVDVPNGSSHIVLRGGVRALDVDPQGKRALVALGAVGRSLVHLLDLRVGGTLVDMGLSFGGEGQPATGAFAPFGQALWARVWRNAATPTLLVNAQGVGAAIPVAEGVDEVWFSPAGAMLLFTKAPASGGGIYLVQADGAGARWLAAGHSPRWHPAP
jgi:dipeptidyl aminopeptidase/acylaminoacyl peptidase